MIVRSSSGKNASILLCELKHEYLSFLSLFTTHKVIQTTFLILKLSKKLFLALSAEIRRYLLNHIIIRNTTQQPIPHNLFVLYYSQREIRAGGSWVSPR